MLKNNCLLIEWFSDQQAEKEFILDGKMFKFLVNTVTQIPYMEENRFGLSLQHAKDFIQAFKNQQIHGYKVCTTYEMEWKSASVHAESFFWNILEYKVKVSSKNLKIFWWSKITKVFFFIKTMC